MLVRKENPNNGPKPFGGEREKGFTLAELVVASAIILIAALAFIVLMTNLLGNQRAASLARTADRVLSSQMETIAGTPWDNLMLKPEGVYQDCVLESDRVSTQSIVAGPESILSEGVEFAVTRNVVWLPDQVRGWGPRENTPPAVYTPIELEVNANVATLHFSENPGYNVGDKVTISNIENGSTNLNGYVQIVAVDPDYNTVSYLATSDDIFLEPVFGTDPTVIKASISLGYPVGFEPTGDWELNPGSIAYWNGTSWDYALPVSCDGFRNENIAKAITITVTWVDGTFQREKTATIIRSRWLESSATP